MIRGTDRLSTRRGTDVDNPLLLRPDPERQGAVEDGVDGDCGCCVELCVFEAELVIPEEAGAGYG
jgi:hypothetical protein